MMIWWTILAVAAAAETPAETPAENPVQLSYAHALEQALALNPVLQGSQLDVDAADGVLLAAKGIYDPTLNANTTTSRATNESTREFGEVISQNAALSWGMGLRQFAPTGTTVSLDWSSTQSKFRYELRESGFIIEQNDPVFETRIVATISQSLLEGHRIASNLEGVRQAARGLDMANADRDASRQQTLADVATAYWDLRYLQRLADIAEHALQTAQEEQRIVHLQVDQGTLAPVSRFQVDAAVVQADSARIKARHDAQAAADGLLLLVGQEPGRPVVLMTEPAEPVPISLDIAAVVQSALAANPELLSARVREEATDMARRHARHMQLPQLDANLSYALNGYEPSPGGATKEMFAGDLPEWSMGGTLSFPLLNRADRGEFRSKNAAAARAQIDRLALERAVSQQVRAQARTVVAAHAQVRLSRANEALEEKTLDAQRALREAGRAIQKDVLEAISKLNDAKVATEKALADYQLALIELERLKGSL
jgi:outer membrane protein TolC